MGVADDEEAVCDDGWASAGSVSWLSVSASSEGKMADVATVQGVYQEEDGGGVGASCCVQLEGILRIPQTRIGGERFEALDGLTNGELISLCEALTLTLQRSLRVFKGMRRDAKENARRLNRIDVFLYSFGASSRWRFLCSSTAARGGEEWSERERSGAQAGSAGHRPVRREEAKAKAGPRGVSLSHPPLSSRRSCAFSDSVV